MRRKIITLILIIGLWQGFALSIDKAVIYLTTCSL